jgi:hypothetical protein
MNLRLRPEAEDALRAESERSRRSQQELLREAVDVYLGLGVTSAAVDPLLASGALRPPRSPLRRTAERLRLPEGMTSAELLDRDDRI